MLLTNSRISKTIKVDNSFIDSIDIKSLSHKKRSFFGKVYVSFFGVDRVYKIKGRLLNDDDYENIINFSGDIVRVSGWANDDGEYYMEKLKLKKFSLENMWYHIEFTLIKHHIRV